MSNFKNKFFVLALFFSLALVARGEDISFKRGGKVAKTFTLDELKKLVTPKAVTVWEPHADQNWVYETVAFNDVMNKVFGDSWKDGDEILFTCVDGYQPTVEVSRFKKYSAYLAYGRQGQSDFSLKNRYQNNEHVELGPFYLVWDNLSQPEVKKEGAHGWPYQLASVDIIKFSERFPHIAPKAAASESVHRGFKIFRNQCMSCHALNGEGGAKGFELNYPVSITEMFKDEWLRKWISDPMSLRYNTTMPALDRKIKGKEREKTLDDIVGYLKYMAKNKIKPKPIPAN